MPGHMTDQRHDALYLARGVSASKAEVHAAIDRHDPGLFPGAFCKVVPDHLTGSAAHCLAVHADGAGTKSSLGYLVWKETGDESVWAGIAQDSLVMNLDDCACIGATGPFLISNTIGRNAKRIPGSVIAGIVNGYQRLSDRLTGLGIPCVMTGGETADVGDLVRTLIVDSTIAVRLRRDEVIDAGRMAPGDVIVGFSSTGQAAWEDTANHGMGSNGLTAARHELLGADYRTRYPETYAPEIDPALVYCGKYRVQDALPGATGVTVGQAILSPTRTYVPLIRDLIARVGRADLHGLIHCSGGGQSKIVKFGQPGNRYVKDTPFPVPPLFAALKDGTGNSWAEMYSVFNMGWRLEAIVPPQAVAACLDAAAAARIEARVVGRVERNAAEVRSVQVTTPDGIAQYT
jgi:phosphoribosylformylglycinamidine cyclo-ligase